MNQPLWYAENSGEDRIEKERESSGENSSTMLAKWQRRFRLFASALALTEGFGKRLKKSLAGRYYTGSSMSPTLRTGDGLRVIPYGDSKIRIGDVVVYLSPKHDRYVVHRVVSINAQGICTKGDNNKNIDPWVLRPDDIIGRVVSARRKGRRVNIRRGEWSRIFAPAHWVRKLVNLTIFRIFHPVYHYFAQSDIIGNVFSRRFKTQILYFKRTNGIEMQLLMGQWVIGRCPPGKDQWQIRRPFRLFVNEASLPLSKHEQSS